MQFIDTHIHLQDYKTRSAPQVLAAAAAAGVRRVVCAAIREADWADVAALHEQNADTVIPAFGLHPWYLDDCRPGWETRLAQMLEKYPRALVGEAGLDRLKNPQPLPQKEIFAAQADLARQYGRPLLIHAVKAQEWLEDLWDRLPPKFVFHSFNGKKELLQKIVKTGGYVSLAPSISGRPGKEDMIAVVPAGRLLLETDGPYQGEPEQLPGLLQYVAGIRKSEAAELAATVYQNSEEFINVGK